MLIVYERNTLGHLKVSLTLAQVSVYKDGSKGERYADLDHVDVDLMLKGASLRVVFLNGFVRKILVGRAWLVLHG